MCIRDRDRTLLRPISKAIMASDVGITPIDDGQTIRLNFPAPVSYTHLDVYKRQALPSGEFWYLPG